MRFTMTSTGALLAALSILSAPGGCSKPATDGKPAGLPPLAMPPAPQPTAERPSAAPPEAAAPSGGGLARVAADAFGPPGPASAQPADPASTISGTIVLPEANRARVARGAVMFLTARRADGPPGPVSMLAVQKLAVDTFPMAFAISERDAMIPGIPFEGPVTITVRVDQDGDPMTRRRGDVYGQATNVKVGARTVKITLDGVQQDDRTLPGGPGPMGDASPHGGASLGASLR